MINDIIIVGAGASGMIAAILAAKEKRNVILLEQKDRIGKKILATGNGKCNYTNEYQGKECYHSENTSFPMEVLSFFGKNETIAFFQELGIYPKVKKGYIYPNSEQATALLDVLRMELERYHVQIFCETAVKQIRKKQKNGTTFFEVICEQKGEKECSYTSRRVILSTGGKAASKLGSDGSGYFLAKQLGHSITTIAPALIGLKAKETCFRALAGVRTEAKITLWMNQKEIVQEMGELQLTNYGISGIPVFQISRYANLAFESEKKQKTNIICEIDFLPTMNAIEIQSFFETMKRHSQKTIEDSMVGLLNKKLNVVLLKKANIPLQKSIHKVTKEEWNTLIFTIKHFSVIIIGNNGFEQAQVTAGGVNTKEINSKTMESKKVKGLYLTGELLDVDGICGGYNLQWAWSTGVIAGKAASLKFE